MKAPTGKKGTQTPSPVSYVTSFTLLVKYVPRYKFCNLGLATITLLLTRIPTIQLETF